MGKIVKYQHHNFTVSVDESLKGKHRDHCLCFRCHKFHPVSREGNCPIANLLFALDCAFGLTTPVYECSVFVENNTGATGPMPDVRVILNIAEEEGPR